MDGCILDSSLGFHYFNSNASSDLNNPKTWVKDNDIYIDIPFSVCECGSYHRNYPPAISDKSWSGCDLLTYKSDLYNHVILEPASVALGNLLSSQVQEFTVWNSFFIPQTLSDILGVDVDGLEIIEPIPAPTVFSPLEIRTYQLSIDAIGPSVIDGKFYFHCTDETTVLSVTGKRVVLWPFIPQVDFTESIEWLTNVIRSKSSEQRIAMRITPRRSISSSYFFDGNMFSRAKMMVESWKTRLFGVPFWPDAEYVGAVSSGVSTIYLDTTSSDFVTGDTAIVFTDDTKYEAVEILSIDDTYISLVLPTIDSYVNAYVMPIIFSAAAEGMRFSRGKDLIINGSITFLSTDSHDICESDMVQYKGVDVLLDRSVLLGDFTEKVYSDVTTLDDSAGSIVYIDNYNDTEHEQVIGFDSISREELWRIKKWLYSRKGRQKPFYLPTWNTDLFPIADLVGVSSSITVKYASHSEYGGSGDILIVKSDGSVLFNTILNVIKDVSGNEIINLTNPIGEDVPLQELDMVCMISYVRLDSDRVEVKYRVAGAASIRIPVRKISI